VILEVLDTITFLFLMIFLCVYGPILAKLFAEDGFIETYKRLKRMANNREG